MKAELLGYNGGGVRLSTIGGLLFGDFRPAAVDGAAVFPGGTMICNSRTAAEIEMTSQRIAGSSIHFLAAGCRRLV